VRFSNVQKFDITSTVYVQDIQQSTTTSAETISRDGGLAESVERRFSYPLLLNIGVAVNKDGSGSQTTTVQQSDGETENRAFGPFTFFTSDLLNEVKSTDTLYFNAAGAITGHSNSDSSQTYLTYNSFGYCYSRTITSAAGLLTSVSDGSPCRHR
jgi:YD repeat-containing protein